MEPHENVELESINSELEAIDHQIHELKLRREELKQLRKRVLEEETKSVADSLPAIDWETEEFEWSKAVRNCLSQTFGLHEFRPLQLSALNILLHSTFPPHTGKGERKEVERTQAGLMQTRQVRNCLLIAGTGAGKSLCYQLPPMVLGSLALVISPLISLIEDQLIQLRRLGILAATLNQSSTKEEAKQVSDALIGTNSSLRLLYVTPEKLAKSKRLMHQLEKCAAQGRLCLIAVDEVHCCSCWGHDFRPDYQFLNVLKKQFKQVPLLGLTATATSAVLDDVKTILGIEQAVVLRANFHRPNLRYEVRAKPPNNENMLEDMVALIRSRELGLTASGIIYAFSRKECEEIAQQLAAKGVSSAFYHAYIEPDERRRIHEAWLAGRYRVIVATTAFGMGIDKEDVRFVIHHSIPKSMENYYQESGRAGRDGKQARCILYYRLADIFRQSSMVCTERTGLKNLYAMLNYAIEKARCRRSLLAEHFNERLESSLCKKTCDTCLLEEGNSQEPTSSPAGLLPSVGTIIREQERRSENNRITGNKLAELLHSRASRTNGENGKRPSPMSRTQVEGVIARLLLEGFLREDFHFTPYSVISYVSLTPKGMQYTNRVDEDAGRGKKRRIESSNEPVIELE